jgi:hypothetical protein
MGEPRTTRARAEPTEPSISEEGKLRARNGRLNFALSIRLPRNRKGVLMCRKSTTQDPRLYFPLSMLNAIAKSVQR